MPYKENMITKKGLIVEALMRVIIAVVLVVIAFNIGKKVAEAAFGGSNLQEPFNKFVQEINKVEGSKEAFIILETNTAIIGFSKDKDYQCYGCGACPKEKLETQFKHHPNAECKDSACVCLCLKGLPKIKGEQQVLDISCENLQCKKLNSDIYPKIELGDLVYKKYGSNFNRLSSWQGGFLYARDVGEVSASISGLPKNSERKMTVFLEKKNVGGNTYVAVCPVAPCIQEQK